MVRFAIWMFWVGLTVLPIEVFGQAYPNRPIRIVTSGVGSGNDFNSRLIAQGISGGLGQQIVVENRPSALIGEAVAHAKPDGHTLLLAAGVLWIEPLMHKTLYDPVSDFSPITLVSSAPTILVVHPSLPAKSLPRLIALAKARPGELNYGSSGSGSTPHLAAELFKAMAGVNIMRIPYKGTAPALNDLIGGQVQLMFAPATSVVPHLKSGRLTAMAVTSAQPSVLFPELPTIAASGLPGYESGTVYGLFAPSKTPEAIIKRLNQEIVRFLKTAEAKEKLFNFGTEAIGNLPEEFAAWMKADMVRLGKVIKDAGIREE